MPILELLTCCLLLAGTAIAQDERPGTGDGAGVEPAPVVKPRGPKRPLDTLNLASIGSPISIIVEHEPYRIAPASTGTLILRITVTKGRKVLAGGKIDLENEQGPLVLGAPVWDPLPEGKAAYDDTFLIKVPLSVKAGTRYDLYPIDGKIQLRGDFTPVNPQTYVRDRAGDPAIILGRPDFDHRRAECGFKGKIKVGPPVPAVPAVFLKRGEGPQLQRKGRDKGQASKVSQEGFEARARLSARKLIPGGPAVRLFVTLQIPGGRYIPAAKLRLEVAGSTSGLIINEPSYPPIKRRSREAPAYRGELEIPVLIHAASSALPGARRLRVKLSFESGGEGAPDEGIPGKLELGVFVTVLGQAPVRAGPAGDGQENGNGEAPPAGEGSPLWPMAMT
ncbi:MAG: hypothetical protein ACE5F1_07040, partial [Planctomycetota bacterium]